MIMLVMQVEEERTASEKTESCKYSIYRQLGFVCQGGESGSSENKLSTGRLVL